MQKNNCELAEMVFVDGEMVGSSPLHYANPLGLNCSQILPLPGTLAFPLIDFLVFRLVLSEVHWKKITTGCTSMLKKFGCFEYIFTK